MSNRQYAPKRAPGFLPLLAVFVLFVIFLYGPMITIFILSFQGPEGGLTFPLRGESLQWLGKLAEGLGGVDVQPAVRTAYEKACILLDLPFDHLCLADGLSDIRMAGFGMAGLWLIDHLGAARTAKAELLSDELKFLLSFCEKAPVRPDILARTRDMLRATIDEQTILLMPTAPQAAFAHGRAPANQADFTALANIAGLPALALPAGWSKDGLPVSLQLVGAAASEASLFAVARQLDAALDAYCPPATFGY